MKIIKIPVDVDSKGAIKYPDNIDSFGLIVQEGEFLIGEYHGVQALTNFSGVWPRPVPDTYKESFRPIELLAAFTSDELLTGLVSGGLVAAQIQLLAMNREGVVLNIDDPDFISAMNTLETNLMLTKARKNELKKGIKVKNNAP